MKHGNIFHEGEKLDVQLGMHFVLGCFCNTLLLLPWTSFMSAAFAASVFFSAFDSKFFFPVLFRLLLC